MRDQDGLAQVSYLSTLGLLCIGILGSVELTSVNAASLSVAGPNHLHQTSCVGLFVWNV